MSYLSLNGSLRTCKVEQGYAPRIQSDRFENPGLMTCPVWSGFDLANRPVAYDSFYTKSAGCNSPLDRVAVENDLRPQYMEYINLDAEGFRYPTLTESGNSAMSCKNASTNMSCYNSGVKRINMKNLDVVTGNFNVSPSNGQIQSRCGNYPDQLAARQIQNREMQAVQHAVQGNHMRTASGM